MNATRREVSAGLIAAFLMAGIAGLDELGLADDRNQGGFEPRTDLPPTLLVNIRTFFGSVQGNYFIDNHNFDRVYPAYDQFRTAFAAPVETVDIGRGLRLVSGFKPHDAPISAALVASASNDVLAAALVHLECRRDGFISEYPGFGQTISNCAFNPMATIFVGLDTNEAVAATSALRAWAHKAIEVHRIMFPRDPNNSKSDVIEVFHL